MDEFDHNNFSLMHQVERLLQSVAIAAASVDRLVTAVWFLGALAVAQMVFIWLMK